MQRLFANVTFDVGFDQLLEQRRGGTRLFFWFSKRVFVFLAAVLLPFGCLPRPLSCHVARSLDADRRPFPQRTEVDFAVHFLIPEKTLPAATRSGLDPDSETSQFIIAVGLSFRVGLQPLDAFLGKIHGVSPQVYPVNRRPSRYCF